jgi:hypothetical protein
MGISESDDLAGIGRISEDFLITVIEVLKTTSPTADPVAPMADRGIGFRLPEPRALT